MTIEHASDDKALMKALMDAETENFVELGALVGLDPAKDYRFADLRGVDFSDCDLRGFDFTGADLTNSTGTETTWDETTILTDADIEGSIFEVKA